MATAPFPTIIIKAPSGSGFTSVFTQGAADVTGVRYECTEARQLLLTNAGDMLLGTGRWMDTTVGTGQILRYLGNGAWSVEVTAKYQTIAGMGTISFPDIGVDHTVAGVWGTNKTPVLIRNNKTKTWIETDIQVSTAGGAQVRSFSQHVDTVNGQHMIFAGQTPLGVLSGVYSTDGKATITWNLIPELHTDAGGFRVMAFATLGGVLYCAMGETIYGRVDGAGTWTSISTNPNPGVTNPPLGALRGLIASPYNDGTLWAWNCCSSGTHANALVSLNPATKVWKTVFSFAAGGGIQAYNTINILHGTVYIGGQRGGADIITGTPATGFKVQIAPQLGATPLVAVRTIGQDAAGNVYMAGYDCDNRAAHRTGWVYQYTP